MLFILIGFVTGIFSGLVGLGGGAILIPALMYLFGFSQRLAQGTSLAMMLPPIGFLAAWYYYKEGMVDVKVASLLVIGFFIGGLVGAKVAFVIPIPLLKKILGLSLVGIGLKLFFS